MASSSSGLERHVLIRCKESHELRHLDDFDESSSVNIEMVPGFSEVFVEISSKLTTVHTLMSLKNFGSSGSGGSLIHPEVARWETLLGLLLEGTVLNHGSHEDIISILS